jgi:hypothetical protein
MSFRRYVIIVGVLFMGTYLLIQDMALSIWLYAARHPGEGLARSTSVVLVDMLGSGKLLTNMHMYYTLGFIMGVYSWSIGYIGRRYFSRGPATDKPLRRRGKMTG